MPARTVTLLFCLTLASTTTAEIFTWTDKDGVVHFTDQRPPGEPVATVSPQAPSVMPMGDNLEAAEAISETVRLPPVERRPAQVGKERREHQQKRCELYRERLRNIQSQLRAGYSNDRGNRLRARRRDLSGRLSRECILK